MPNQRAAGQKQVITLMDESFVRRIESGMKMAGYSDRSKFIRDAVFEKLQRLGIPCDYTLAMAPSRTGKGGPKTAATSPRARGLRPGANVHLNETPPSYGGKKKRKK
ncbi:MAG: ribbon-helix-helix domain-containing protein [Verrucomicrobiota bacterium]